jgi:hypothetical protein
MIHSKYKLNVYKFDIVVSNKDNEIKVNNTYFDNVPLIIFIKALGMDTHLDIM